jgi:hypothetical protein
MKPLRREAGTRILAYAVSLLAAAPLLAWLDAPIHRPQDEGILLVYPDLILRGLLPHRDFLASYPPGNFLVLTLLYEAFGHTVAVERATGLLYRLGLIAAVVALANRRSAAVGALAGVTTAVILHPLRLEAFSWIGGLALLTWATVALLATRHALAGALIGLALWYRLDLVFPAGLILGAAMATASNEDTRIPRRMWAVLMATLAPLILYFVLVSPLQALDDLVLGPVLWSGPARRLPLASLGTNSLRLLLLLAIGVGVALAAAWRRREPGTDDRRDAALTAALCVGLLPQALQRLDADHLIYACAVAGGLLALGLDRILDRLLDRVPVLLIAAVIVLTTAGAPALQLMTVSVSHLREHPRSARLHRNDRMLPARSTHEIAAYGRIGTVLHARAKPGDRLFIGPKDLSRTNYADVHLYYLFPELVPASYFIELNPGSANRNGTRLTHDLETADWILLSGEWNQWGEANASIEPGDSRPNAVVRRLFEPVARYGVWELFQRRASSS